ncbi:diacylglycerol/lipid kinase family protein [Aquirufa sp. A-Brett2-15D]
MIHFILNPNSGTNSPQRRARIVANLRAIPNSKVWITEHVNHASVLTKQAVNEGAKKIIAIGGDGTINEVASSLIYSSIPLGIIPMGSGNGLARHLGIPLSFTKALDRAINGQQITIDAGKWNDRPFFCTAGLGFDAYVASHFASRGKRGFLNYIYSSLVLLFKYKPISIKEFGPVFSFTVANANQFGNNAYISPNSDLQDGLLEVIRVKPSNLFHIIFLGISLFSKKLHLNSRSEVSTVTSLTFHTTIGIPYHLDGESLLIENEKNLVSILPSSLLVVK